MLKHICGMSAAAALVALPAFAQDHAAHQNHAKLMKGASVAIEGCVTAGQKPDTFVLGTVKEIPGHPVETGKTRVYWVERKHLRGHVGHVVQLSGRVDDISNHELEVKSTDEGVVVEIESAGRQAKTTPATVPVPLPTSGQKEIDIPTTVIKLKVDKVEMKGTCGA